MKSEQEIRKHFNDLIKIMEKRPELKNSPRVEAHLGVLGWILEEYTELDWFVEKINRTANEI